MMSFTEAQYILQIMANTPIIKEKQTLEYFLELAKRIDAEKIRKIMTSEVISNPPLTNEQMLSFKAHEIEIYLKEGQNLND